MSIRKKDDILNTFDILLGKEAGNKELAIRTAYQFLEVLIDIRDIFDNYQKAEARRYGECFDGEE